MSCLAFRSDCNNRMSPAVPFERTTCGLPSTPVPSPRGEPVMRPLWKKVAALGFLLFLALWVAGTIRGSKLPYSRPPAAPLTLGHDNVNQRLQAANNLRQIG